MVDDELNQRDMEFEPTNNDNISNGSSTATNPVPTTVTINKNSKSNKKIRNQPDSVRNPQTFENLGLSYDKRGQDYIGKMNSKSHRTGGKKNISAQPVGVNNIKNYMN